MQGTDEKKISVQARLETLSRPTEHLYGLIDLANFRSEAPRLQRWLAAADAHCIFSDAAPAAQLASPWLVSIPSEQADTVCRRSVELAERSAAVSWLLTTLPVGELARRLKERTEARLPDHYDVLLRHFDPRVFPVLHKVLKKRQRAAFFGLGIAWLYLDRAGLLAKIALTQAPIVDEFNAPLELNEDQAAQLLDAAEIDAVMPELVKEVNRPAF